MNVDQDCKVSSSKSWRLLAALVVCAAALAVAYPEGRNPQQLERLLNAAYKGKILLLREFHSGDELKYDAQGNLVRGGPVGPWTLDGELEVAKMRLREDRVEIEGKRLYLQYSGQKQKFLAHPAGTVLVRIESKEPIEGVASAQLLISKVFMSQDERIADILPPYWKAFMSGDVGRPPKAPDGELPVRDLKKPGVTPPVPIRTPEPRYSDEARQAKVEGALALSVVVDEKGDVADVELVKPIGLGLDEKAVETVSKWKFKPATRDRLPVRVRVMVEVTFRLR